MAKLYNTWRRQFLVEQAKIDFFNKTVICIKNNLAKRAYKTLALHALKGRLKKRADVHHYLGLLSKVVKSLQLRVDRRIRSQKQFQTLQVADQELKLRAHFS